MKRVEHLPSMHEGLGSVPGATTKKNNKTTKKTLATANINTLSIPLKGGYTATDHGCQHYMKGRKSQVQHFVLACTLHRRKWEQKV